MANLTDATYVRAFGRIPLTLTTAEIQVQIPGSAVVIKRWVGASLYATVLAEIDVIRATLTGVQTLEANGNLNDQQRALRDAETNIVMGRLVRPMNLVFADMGINTSVVTERGNTNALRPDQEADKIKQYMAEARSLARDYFTWPVLQGGKARATDDEGNYI